MGASIWLILPHQHANISRKGLARVEQECRGAVADEVHGGAVTGSHEKDAIAQEFFCQEYVFHTEIGAVQQGAEASRPGIMVIYENG